MKKQTLFLCLALLAFSLACSLINAPISPTPTPGPAGNIQQARAVLRVETVAQASITPKSAPDAPKKPTQAPSTPNPNICSVIAQNLHLRAFPGVDAPVIGYLHAGEVLTITQTAPAGVWIQIHTQAGVTGWVNSIFTTCSKG